MSTPQPIRIKQLDTETLAVTWTDGHEGNVRLTTLRDSCPCAGCKGETVLLRTYQPPPPDTRVPDRYRLVNAEIVGTYALKLVWADGHDTGLYHWEYLRSLCECEKCSAARSTS